MPRQARLSNQEGMLFDERILGSGEFVERVIGEAEAKVRHQLPLNRCLEDAKGIIEEACRKENLSLEELRSGSRLRIVACVRKRLIRRLVTEQGLPLADVARLLGVTTPAVAKSLARQA